MQNRPAKKSKITDPGTRAILYNWLNSHTANKSIVQSLQRDGRHQLDHRQFKLNLSFHYSSCEIEIVDDILQQMVNKQHE